jgi:hypothetical protein
MAIRMSAENLSDLADQFPHINFETDRAGFITEIFLPKSYLLRKKAVNHGRITEICFSVLKDEVRKGVPIKKGTYSFISSTC